MEGPTSHMGPTSSMGVKSRPSGRDLKLAFGSSFNFISDVTSSVFFHLNEYNHVGK
jgi:hypothetical protein